MEIKHQTEIEILTRSGFPLWKFHSSEVEPPMWEILSGDLKSRYPNILHIELGQDFLLIQGNPPDDQKRVIYLDTDNIQADILNFLCNRDMDIASRTILEFTDQLSRHIFVFQINYLLP